VTSDSGGPCWVRGASLAIDRWTWLDVVHVTATTVRVIAIRDLTLRMRAALADCRLFSPRDSSFVNKDPASGRVCELVLETLAIPLRLSVGTLTVSITP